MQKSELEVYLDEPRVQGGVELDVLEFWKGNQFRYPELSCMARDILSIPISTVASESAFSVGGRVLDQYRSSLKPAVVETLVCTRDWLFGDKGIFVFFFFFLCLFTVLAYVILSLNHISYLFCVENNKSIREAMDDTEDVFSLDINEPTIGSSQNSHNLNTSNAMEGNKNFLMACLSYKFHFINKMFSFSMNRLKQLEEEVDRRGGLQGLGIAQGMRFFLTLCLVAQKVL